MPLYPHDDSSSTSFSSSEAALDLVALFERYHQEIYRLCLGMLDDPSEAEDAAQEVFLRVHRNWASYDARRAQARTWLGQIAVNYCRSQLRRRRLWQLSQRLVGRGQSERPLHDLDLRADLSQVLLLLDERHRIVVVLRYYLDLSCAEIANILRISEGTVHSRLYHARRRLLAALGEEDQ